MKWREVLFGLAFAEFTGLGRGIIDFILLPIARYWRAGEAVRPDADKSFIEKGLGAIERFQMDGALTAPLYWPVLDPAIVTIMQNDRHVMPISAGKPGMKKEVVYPSGPVLAEGVPQGEVWDRPWDPSIDNLRLASRIGHGAR